MVILTEIVLPFDSVVLYELNHWFSITVSCFDSHRLNRQAEFTETIIVPKLYVVPQMFEVVVSLTRIIREPC